MNLSGESFQYDPLGRRVAKTIVGTTTNYLYDGVNPVQELSGTTVTANLLTGRVDEYFQRTDSVGARSFLSDALGGTLALTDSTGTIQTSYTYEPFGNTTVSGSSTSTYQYTGRENDGTGVYFYRNRHYSPTLQRFISEDPIGFASGQPNFYAYVGDDPADYTDPFGLDKSGGTCSPPTTKFPTTIGASAAASAASNNDGTTYTANAAVTGVVSLTTGAVGAMSNVGPAAIPAATPPGDPEANGQYAGGGFQVVLSNGQPGQLLGPSTSYQVSAGLIVVGGTVAYSTYANGVYRLSFTPYPGLPASASLGLFYKKNVPQNTRGVATGCH